MTMYHYVVCVTKLALKGIPIYTMTTNSITPKSLRYISQVFTSVGTTRGQWIIRVVVVIVFVVVGTFFGHFHFGRFSM